MRHQANAQPAAALVSWAVDEAGAKARRLGRGIVELLAICADGWAAVNMYQELSKLSDPELERRGISRAELPQHVLEASSR